MSRVKKQKRAWFWLAVVVLYLCLGTGCDVPPVMSQVLPTLAATAAVPTATPQSAVLLPTPTLSTAQIAPTYTPFTVEEGVSLPHQSTATPTAVATETAVPTITPTSLPQISPSLVYTDPIDIDTSSIPIPTPVPEFDVPLDTTNILLIGNDGGVNTDTMIIVAINRSGPTASMISLPRDLFVYLPGVQMGRLNTAAAIGGVELLKQTVLYNFGIPIHYYARVDFEGFKAAVDILGGVEIAESCELRDWKLISPHLDPELESSWEMFTLEPGVHRMDGETALWYVRSRRTSSDFERGRRQQQLLRAILTQAVDLGTVTEFPAMWEAYQSYIDTDIDLGRALQLASLAPAIRKNGVQHLYLAGRTEPWISPGGARVHLPVWEGEGKMEETFSRLFLPPALNMSEQSPITVEIINASGNPDLTALAADNLAWFGFIPVVGETAASTTSRTTLTYYRPNFKGSYDWLISWVFGMRRSAIALGEDATVTTEYRVVLGEDYDPCRPQLYAPQIYLNQ